MKNYLRLFNIILGLIITASASAQDEWVPAGPSAIDIYDFELLDSRMYIGTSGNEGAVRSTASFGADWTELSENFPSDQTPAADLAVKGSDVYAAAHFRGLYVLRGGDEPWVKIPVDGDLQSIVTILFAGEPWNRTFLGGSRLKGMAGVNMSEDEINWTPISDSLQVAGSVYSLLSVDSSIYAATTVGVYRLDFGSDEWVPTGSGALQSIKVNELVYNGSYFFAGSDHGVFRSSDGQNWQDFNMGLHTAATDYNAFAFDGPNIFVASSGQFGGVYQSVNEGNNWVKINEGLPLNPSINALIINGPYLFAGSDANGVYRRERLFTAVDNQVSTPSVNIFPNPNDGQFKVQIDHSQYLTGRIHLTDILGRLVYDTPFICDGGNCDFNIQLNANYSGLFFLRLEGENYDLSHKVIIR